MGAMARIRTFFKEDLFKRDLARVPLLERIPFYVLRTLVLAVKGVWVHSVGVWASSLTYTTLISIVPFLALVAGVSVRLGVPRRILASLTGRIPEHQRQIVESAIHAFEKANLNAVGAIAIVVLFYAAIATFFNIEAAFNTIWGVSRNRGIVRRGLIYALVVVVAPALVLGATGLTASLMNSSVVQWVVSLPYAAGALHFLFSLLPYLAVWGALILLYWLMPYTRVRILSAVTGSIVAGSIWVIVQKLYFEAQVGLSRYSILYGAFAAVPIFLIWVYVSWVVVLLGTEICYGVQHAKTFRFEAPEEEPSRTMLEDTAMRVALLLAATPEETMSVDGIAEAIGAPARIVNRILGHLSDARVVREIGAGSEHYRLADSPGRISAAQIIRPLSEAQEETLPGRDAPEGSLATIRELRERSLSPFRATLADLLDGPEGEVD